MENDKIHVHVFSAGAGGGEEEKRGEKGGGGGGIPLPGS